MSAFRDLSPKKLLSGLFFVALVISLSLTGYSRTAEAATVVKASSAIDYSDEENWAYYASSDGVYLADVFFVCPTVFSGSDDSYTMGMDDERAKRSFLGAVNMEKGIYDEYTRFFAPYYRQVGLNVYEMEEADREPWLKYAYEDVKDAFLYYMENENNGTPIILAGFSQGADLCLRLLKDCFADEYMQNLLVACYAIGWRVTDEDLERYPQLKFAESADDTGVIIAFNTEDPAIDDSLLIPAGTRSLCINPLTWSRSPEPADRSLNLGACFTNYSGEIETEIPYLTGAYIDEERGALKVTDVSPEDYPAGLSIFTDGIYHLYDYQFFYRNLQENVRTRIAAYYLNMARMLSPYLYPVFRCQVHAVAFPDLRVSVIEAVEGLYDCVYADLVG